MLQLIFGDDEHTAADGTYSRVLKIRKWLYLSSVASLIITLGFYDERSATSLVKVIKLPTELVSPALMFTVLYLLVQYIFLLVQLHSTYDIVLNDRFIFRRAEELASARAKMLAAQLQLKNLVDEEENYIKSVFNAQEKQLKESIDKEAALLNAAKADLSALQARGAEQRDLDNAAGAISAQTAAHGNVTNALYKLRERRLMHDTSLGKQKILNAQNFYEQTLAQFKELNQLVPSERPRYQFSERVIDLSRIAPPLILSITAMCKYWIF